MHHKDGKYTYQLIYHDHSTRHLQTKIYYDYIQFIYTLLIFLILDTCRKVLSFFSTMRSSLFTGAVHEYLIWYKPRISIYIHWMEGCITMFCNGLKLIGLKGMSMWSLFIKFQTCIRDFSVKLPYLFRKWMGEVRQQATNFDHVLTLYGVTWPNSVHAIYCMLPLLLLAVPRGLVSWQSI